MWWKRIEDKLKISEYVEWTFVSCQEGVRKPDEKIYKIVSDRLKMQPSDLVFIDDSAANVEAARLLGWKGIVFRDADQLKKDLAILGIFTTPQEKCQ